MVVVAGLLEVAGLRGEESEDECTLPPPTPRWLKKIPSAAIYKVAHGNLIYYKGSRNYISTKDPESML